MKTLKIFAILIATLLVFASCDDEDDTLPKAAPSITFANNITSYEVDFDKADPYTVTIIPTVVAEAEISTFTVRKRDADGASQPVSLTGNPSGEVEFSETITLQVSSDERFPLSIVFEVTDRDDRAQERIFTITAKEIEEQLTPFETEKNGKFHHIAGPDHGAYDLDADETVGISGDDSKKSMRNRDNAGFPFTGNWISDNQTFFVKTTLNYEDIYQENVADVFDDFGPSSAIVSNPSVGEVYVAKRESNYYVIKITEIDANYGDGNNKGRITFTYKK